MLAYTYLEKGTFRLTDKPKPVLREPGDALVRVTLSSICTSDLHIKHGSVPPAPSIWRRWMRRRGKAWIWRHCGR